MVSFSEVLFLMATVLIIYYKQISEGYDDKERFQIMQKVGMSREDAVNLSGVKVVSVFALPLIRGRDSYLCAAFKLITRLLASYEFERRWIIQELHNLRRRSFRGKHMAYVYRESSL